MLSTGPHGLCGLDPARLFAPVASFETLGLAVSGGPDSLALMLLYANWDAPDKPRAIVYTLDHGLRPEARAEAQGVAETARALGLDARILTWAGQKPRTGRQQAARQARYRLIGSAMAADGARTLLTAHHRRDQAETVLMRLAHGSGVTGLGAMRDFAEVEGIKVFRPLLGVAPETLMTIVARAGLDPARDPGNADPAYERVRWRKALPLLAGLGLTEDRLAEAARRFQRVDALAGRLADDVLAATVRRDGLGVIAVGRQALRAADPEIAIRVLSRVLALAGGQERHMLGKVEALHERIAGQGRIAATLAGVGITARGEDIVLYREAGRLEPEPVVLAPGASCRWDGRFIIHALAGPVTIAPGHALTREGYRELMGTTLTVPVAALRAAPVIRDASGTILAIGAQMRSNGVAVEQPALTGRR